MNSTLKTAAAWQDARAIVEAAGLQPYERPQAKSWDALRACNYVLRHVPRTVPLLDAGGSPGYSHLSSWLAHYGFTVDVINLELHGDWTEADGRVRFRRGDATRSGYPDASFGAVTCLSVIEHGVALEPFFAEMRRVLVPGGYLIISTDFWQAPIDTSGKHAFGHPVRIFAPEGIEEMITIAGRHGFQRTGVVDYRCHERVVCWLGFQYTFIDFALRLWPA
jgi:SAM-dependent methyltransferase